MSAAQDAQKARKWQDVLARTREAEQTAGAKSQFDLYWMAEFRGYAYHNLRQTAEAARELETALNNPCMPEANKRERYKSLAGLYASLKNHAKVIDYGNRALKVGRDTDMQVAVAQAYYQTGNNKEAVRDDERAARKQRRCPEGTAAPAGRSRPASGPATTPASAMCSKSWWQHYPKPEYWQKLIPALKAAVTTDLQTLNVMRLALHVKVLKKPDDYKEYGPARARGKARRRSAGGAGAGLREQGVRRRSATSA